MTQNSQSRDGAAKRAGRVVVVGAGFAGLAAATELARRGCSVTVLEESASPGGRCGGEQVEGFAIEGRMPLLYSSDRHLLGWIGDLGLAGSLLPPRRVQLAQLADGTVRPVDPSAPSSIARVPGVRWREALRLIRLPRLMNRYRPLLDVDAPERAADLDYRSVGDFGRLYFGQSVVDAFIAPALAGFGEPEDLSRVAFLLDWLARGEGAAPTLVLSGGLEQIANTAALSAKVQFRKSALQVEDNGRGGFSFLIQGENGEERLDAETVVVATGPGRARMLADPLLTLAERDCFGEFSSRSEITLAIALDRELTGIPQLIQVPRSERSAVASMLLDPGGPGLRAPLGRGLVTLCATDAFCREHALAASDVVEKTLLAEFERIYPRGTGRARFTRLHRSENAAPHFVVGAFRVLRRFARVQSDRRALGRHLHFAGDYLVGPRPEHAVASGLRAAREVLEDRA